MRQYRLLTVLCLSIILLSGCWDRREVNDLAIVTAAAIDKKDNNQIELSLQIFIPKTMTSGSSQGGGGGESQTSTLVSSQHGINIADALSKNQAELSRKVFWGQCKIFIFGEDVAKDGIEDHLDFLLRHPQPRERAYVFISKGQAKSILQLEPLLESFSAKTILQQTLIGSGLKVTLQDLDEDLISESKAAELPYLKIATAKSEKKEGSKFPKLVGTAVLRNGQMTGILSERETRGMLWLKDEINDYTVTVKPQNKHGYISINPIFTDVNLIPQIKNNEWEILVKIKTEGNVIENSTTLDLADPYTIKTVEKEYQKQIKEHIKLALDKAQHELNTDVFDFATEFHRSYPKQWKKAENRWDEMFPEVKVTFDIHAHIERRGYLNDSGKLQKKGD